MTDENRSLPPWWLVPNLLALDAPIVAVVWQRFLAGQFDAFVPVAATLALAASVWCIYLTDRCLDARRGVLDADRHRAAARWPLIFACAAALAGSLAAATAVQLPVRYLQQGAVIVLGVTAYLILIHVVAGKLRSLLGAKELLVAVGFAAGVSVPLSVDGQPSNRWLPGVVAFAAVCWLNCRLIERWESAGSDSLTSAWPDSFLGGILLIACLDLPAVIGMAIGGSTLGLLAIHVICRHRPRAARVLADVVLLSPLVCWGIL